MWSSSQEFVSDAFFFSVMHLLINSKTVLFPLKLAPTKIFRKLIPVGFSPTLEFPALLLFETSSEMTVCFFKMDEIFKYNYF